MKENLVTEELLKSHQYIAGLDEAGAGCGAGPLVVACVVLDPNNPILGLADSKILSEKKREELFPLIIEKSLEYHIVEVSPQRIDDINILQARMEGFFQCIEKTTLATCAIIDGNKIPNNNKIPTSFMIKGDQKLQCISAASVLAKVTRDRLMVDMDHVYPAYGFAKHKGYLTKIHLEALSAHGVTPIHRLSYAPVAAVQHISKEKKD